jgi:hypothetical protein
MQSETRTLTARSAQHIGREVRVIIGLHDLFGVAITPKVYISFLSIGHWKWAYTANKG